MKKIVPYALMAIVVACIAKDFIFTPLFPSTHDGENHLARIANFYLALKQGQFPPRIAPNLEAGLGYTSLNFNYPLANILAFPLVVANFTIEFSLKMIFLLSLMAASFGMYTFLGDRYNTKSSLMGSIAYLLAPYFIGNIYIRGNVGEVMAFALLPWVLWSAKKLLKGKGYEIIFSLLLSALLLAHNLIAILSLPFIGMLLALEKNTKESLIKLSKAIAISGFVVSFFWLPALIEKTDTVLEQNPINHSQLVKHFVRAEQLLSSAWDHGYSYAFPVDGMNFSLGLLGSFALIFTPPLLLAEKKVISYEGLLWCVLLIILFLTTEASRFLWELIPAASIIQFPWRLLFFAVFLSSMLIAYVVEKTDALIAGILSIMLIIAIMSKSLGINYFTHNNDYWFTFPLNTTVNNENDPLWYDRTQAFALKDSSSGNLIMLNASGSAVIGYWTGSKHQYELNLNEKTTIIEKTMYFPGWETRIDGKKIPLRDTKYRHAGLINFEVEKGVHSIVTKFTQNTPSRLVGNGLSCIGILLLIAKTWQKKHEK